MSEKVHTYANLAVLPYEFESLLDFELVQQAGEHTRLRLSGIVPEEKLDQYVERADDEERIQVSVQDEERSIVLFEGVVTQLSVRAVRGVRTLTVEANSSTVLLDMKKRTRSFQNTGLLYSDLFAGLIAEYPQADVSDTASQGKSIGGLLVQYQETDWQFVRRLASHFHAPLVPIGTQTGVKFAAGLPDSGEPQTLEAYNYTIKKDLEEYKRKSGGGIDDWSEQDSISYEVSSSKIIGLGSPVQFLQRTLYVFRVESRIEGGVLNHHYVLKERDGFRIPTEFAYALAGASLFGKITGVAKDQVRVGLHIDGGRGGEIWFPYSTVYSSPDGSGWYCMPEVGDEVRLYFPDAQEKHAFAASSVDTASSDPAKRSNPEVKSISTKYGKQIVFQPGSVEIIGSGKLLMRLTDEGGIEINSDKKIVLSAEDDIEITGGAKVLIQGEEGVNLKQANASLDINEEVTISGGKVNIV
ncbi:contractile injection system protein, VgrG/Pvc8 family [Paenibacillus rigui]|uniref:Phage tail protein n=1 Tax=Paenibacillus rigui TaxID=554312 RepID=A0A229UPN7_9BACL|nr:contractile injection system protein, VgrG/Pvc8 family [Paenibacillus rigui]OXM85378.1 phage tail protein [Paenibacillus rigui]